MVSTTVGGGRSGYQIRTPAWSVGPPTHRDEAYLYWASSIATSGIQHDGLHLLKAVVTRRVVFLEHVSGLPPAVASYQG